MTKEERASNGSLPRWLERISRIFGGEPHDRRQLIELLKEAHERDLLDREALRMMEGAMEVSERRACDIMTPRIQLTVLQLDDDLEQVLKVAIETAHSRIPVIGVNADEVIGILLPKDLLRWFQRQSQDGFHLSQVIREALYVPDSMRLNRLLKELKMNRNHMAIVVDEYGSTSGVVTLEDVLEQIVGDIEDEHDVDDHLQQELQL